ncbi:FHA domain-containing protein [Haliangium sp.]|uniref:FHA domain-containing protein n=1 Tax=Haliangium sp. TaxID=2663208 RepID=UPI003D0AFA47
MTRPVWGASSSPPVVALRQLPDGPVFVLDRVLGGGRGRGDGPHALVVGSSHGADIRIVGDRSVSRVHCIVSRIGARWFVHDMGSKNRTSVNGVAVGHSRTQLAPGNLLRLGRCLLVVCADHEGTQSVQLTASNLDAWLRLGRAVYGSGRKAARRLRIVEGTFNRWLREGRWAPDHDSNTGAASA